MKIMAINGSPKKAAGNTERILAPFMQGAAAAGADCTTVYLYDHEIKPCLGCYSCWMKTPGECVIRDDMDTLIEAFRATDILVIASPLYVCGVSAVTKLFLDRIIPVADPHIEVLPQGCVHPPRIPNPNAGMLLVSNCGFHEIHHFSPMVEHIKLTTSISDCKYLGALLRPHGPMLSILEKLNPRAVQAVYAAAREAGGYIARGEEIPPKLLTAVSKDLVSRDAYVRGVNEHIDKVLGEAGG